MGWQPNPYIVEGEAVARCRAAWGAGRPAAGWQGLFCKKFRGKFALGPLEDRSPDSGAARWRPPGSRAAGVYSCKFRKQKYIFVKNEIEKYKNKKPPLSVSWAKRLTGLSPILQCTLQILFIVSENICVGRPKPIPIPLDAKRPDGLTAPAPIYGLEKKYSGSAWGALVSVCSTTVEEAWQALS